MPSARDGLFFAASALAACAPNRGDREIPMPTTQLVRDAGSVLRAPLRASVGCPATTTRAQWGVGTVHGASILGHETWSREGSPHRLPNGIHLLAGASLEVSPCAVVLVGAGREIVVQDDARLRARGGATSPIVFDSASAAPSPGDWIGVEIRAHALPGTRFAFTTIRHAGAEVPQRGEVRAAVRSWTWAGLEFDHLTIDRCAGLGIAALGRSGFETTSRALTVTRNEGPGAVYFADVDRVASLPTVDFRENESNDVVVGARERTLRSDGTWGSPGASVRYRVRKSARIMVQGADSPRLTLAPGAAIAFEEDAELDVGWEAPGALFAEGIDAEHRVGFTAATEVVGPPTWVGVLLGEHLDAARSRFRFARIGGAGVRATGDFVTCPTADGTRLEAKGMIFFQGVRAPNLLTFTEFVAGPSDGVAVLVAGDSPLAAEDFTSSSRGNIFVRAGVRCAQSTAPTMGQCPPSPRCDSGNPTGSSAATQRDATSTRRDPSRESRQR
jgi:hypothetical protein